MSFVMSIYGGKSHTGEISVEICVEPFADHFVRRPKEFSKSSAYPEDSDDEDSTVGKMPPSDSEDDD